MTFLTLLCLSVSLFAQTSDSQKSTKPEAAPESSLDPAHEKLLQAAQDELSRADYASAAKALEEFCRDQPDYVPALFNLAFSYSGLHRNTDAIKTYQRVIELEPDLFPARMNLGILLIEAGTPQSASENLAKAVDLKPADSKAHLYYARSLLALGKDDLAEKELNQVAGTQPGLAEVEYDLGQVYLHEKKYGDAQSAFVKAAQGGLKSAQVELGQALAAEGLNQSDQAIEHFEKYLAAMPDDPETRFHLGGVYLKAGKNEQALACLLKVYETEPQLPGLAAAIGDIQASLKKYVDAEKFYRLAVAANPKQADMHRALGQVLFEQQKFTDAEQEFNTALKLDSHSREAAQGLANSLYEEKKYQQAIPLLEALSNAPHPPVMLYFVLASCYDHLMARPQALANYQKFLQLDQGKNPDQEWQATQRAKLLRRMLGK